MTRNEPCPVCRSRGGDSRGNNRVLYSDGGWHCFSCGDHRSGSRVRLPSEEVNAKQDKACPSDVTREVPLRAWEWLLQYGLGWKYWQPYVQWSEASSRLIFTVGTDFAIGRFIERGVAQVEGRVGTPSVPPKWLVYGDCHRTVHVFGANRGNSVVLVEDLISAHKVGLVNACIPLFGTQVFGSALSALQHMGLPVVQWLDKDQDHSQIKRSANLSLMTGLKVRYVSTRRDPKELSVEEIQEILNAV